MVLRKSSEYLYHRATGSGAMASTFAPDVNFVVFSIRLHLSAAGATAENFTAQVDSIAGIEHDLLLASQDMNTETDFIQTFEDGLSFERGSDIDLAYTNTDANTFGVEIAYREEN